MSAPRTIGEQWLPVPERLVRDIETANTTLRRVSAVYCLVVWVLTYAQLLRSPQPPTVRRLCELSGCTNKGRVLSARSDAQRTYAVAQQEVS